MALVKDIILKGNNASRPPASTYNEGYLYLQTDSTPGLYRSNGTTWDFVATLVPTDLTNFSEAVDDRVGALLVAGTGITLNYNDGANTLTITNSDPAGGSGGVGTGSIADDAVTNAKLRDSAALSVIGRSANSTGDPADIAASNDGEVLRRSGTSLGFGTLATAGVAANAVTNAKLAQMATLTIKGNSTGSTADPSDLSVADVQGMLAAARVNAQTGTTYTLVASDNGKVVTLSNAAAITLTVPSGLGAGFNCLIVQKGAGQVTFSASSTTINNRQSHTKTAGQHAVCTLVADVANNFYLAGDTAT